MPLSAISIIKFLPALRVVMVISGVLLLYYFSMRSGHSLEETRTLVFTTLILANVFLTFSVRSYTQPILTTIRYKNRLALPVLGSSAIFLGLLLLYPPVRQLFELTSITPNMFGVSFATAFASVFWFEVYKAIYPRKTPASIHSTHSFTGLR